MLNELFIVVTAFLFFCVAFLNLLFAGCAFSYWRAAEQGSPARRTGRIIAWCFAISAIACVVSGALAAGWVH
jgi:uncharacterized membrane protein